MRQEMVRIPVWTGSSGNYVYSATVPATRPASDYTARLIPDYEGIATPLEDAKVLWQR